MSGGTQQVEGSAWIFRPRGWGRFGSALFLVLWLCFWAVGEGFALFMLGHGAWSLLTGSPASGSGEPLRMGPALAGGAFLLVWLTIWTVGGVMAMQELLRLTWAEDRLELGREALTRRRRRGPFKSTRQLGRSEIRRVFVRPSNTALMALLNENLVELTDLGTPVQRSAAGERLRAALGLTDADAAAEPAALPDDWREAAGRRGERLLVPNPEHRRTQAVVVTIAASLVWGGLLLLAREALREPELWVVTLMLAPLALWLARKTRWMWRGRKEWRIESGRLVHQRRFDDLVTELCQARALELTESRDSDGDPWYHLNAIELSPPDLAPAGRIPKKIRITHSIHDPTEARCLGRWLARQAGIPLHDRVPRG